MCICRRISILYFGEYGNICCNFRLDKSKLEQKYSNLINEYRNIYYIIKKKVPELMNIKIFILLDKYKVCIYRRILYFVEYGNICYNFRLNKCKLESKSVQVSNRNIYSTGLIDVLDKVCTYRSAN